MHTVSMIFGGLVLLAVFYAVARATSRSLRSMLPVYLVLWLAVCGVNLWIGVTRAGYTVMQELLLLVPVFGLPAMAAFLLARRTRS